MELLQGVIGVGDVVAIHDGSFQHSDLDRGFKGDFKLISARFMRT